MPTALPMQQFTPPPQPGQTVTAQQLSGLGMNPTPATPPMPMSGQNAPPGAPAMQGQPSWAGALMHLLGQLNLPPEIMNHLGGIFGQAMPPPASPAPQQQAGPGPMPGDPGYGGQQNINNMLGAGKGTTGLLNPNAGAVGGNMPQTFTTNPPEPVQTIPQPGKGTMPPPNPNAGAVGGNMPPPAQVNNPALGNRTQQAPQQAQPLQPWQRPQPGAPTPFQTPAPAPTNVQAPMGRQPWQRMQSPTGRVETQPWATGLTGASGSGQRPTPMAGTPRPANYVGAYTGGGLNNPGVGGPYTPTPGQISQTAGAMGALYGASPTPTSGQISQTAGALGGLYGASPTPTSGQISQTGNSMAGLQAGNEQE